MADSKKERKLKKHAPEEASQNLEEVAALEAEALSEGEQEASVETQKGKFSEAFLISDSSRGVIRLVPDPFLYWVATSDAKDNEYLENKVQQCEGNYLEALSACAKERPYGLR